MVRHVILGNQLKGLSPLVSICKCARRLWIIGYSTVVQNGVHLSKVNGFTPLQPPCQREWSPQT